MPTRETSVRWSELVGHLVKLTNKRTVAAQVGVNEKEVGRWERQEARPQGEHSSRLLKICTEYGVNWRKFSGLVPVYDFRSDYRENLENGPQGIEADPRSLLPTVPTNVLGYPLNSPLGIPASVLTMNSEWLAPFCRLGNDVITYKTVRTKETKPHTFPNIAFLPDLCKPVEVGAMPEKTRGVPYIPFEEIASLSVAYSFGMPSPSPVTWQSDFKKAKALLQPGQILNLSIVGTVDQPKDDLVDDFIRCAHLASEVDPHAIELNFSCPNAYCKDEGSIYRNPELATRIVTRIRHELRGVKVIAKIGYLKPEKLAEFFKATYKYLDGYTAINTMPVDIVSEKGEQVFPSDNNRRKKAGISGTAIRYYAVTTVRELRKLAKAHKPELAIFATGGVSSAEHVKSFLDAGASAVQICTAAILNPHISAEIRRQLGGQRAPVNTSKYLADTTLNIGFTDAEIALAFDRLLETCDELRVPFDKGFRILEKNWLSEYAKTLIRIESGSTEIAATRRAAPTKAQFISWVRNEYFRQ